jgi:hypothetical protein
MGYFAKAIAIAASSGTFDTKEFAENFAARLSKGIRKYFALVPASIGLEASKID